MCSKTGSENLPRLFRVAVGEQFHGTLEVGEQDGHLLALPFQGGLGGEDFLGQVLGGVGLRGGRTSRGRGASGDGVAALEAEAGAPGQFCATGAAGEREVGSAAEAEPGVNRVVLLASGTLHAGEAAAAGHSRRVTASSSVRLCALA